MPAEAGQVIVTGPWRIEFHGIMPAVGADFTALEARIIARRAGTASELRPQWRTNIGSRFGSSPPIAIGWWTGRLTSRLERPDTVGSQRIDLRWEPWIALPWIGAALALAGIILILLTRTSNYSFRQAGLRLRPVGVAGVLVVLGFAIYAILRLEATASRTPHLGSVSPDLSTERHSFFGTFTPAERWLIMADSYGRSGDTLEAAQLLQAAVTVHPDDPELWVGLGNALVDHGKLGPAANFAFYRAIELAPAAPAPRFFLALAMKRSGDRAGARAEWENILAQAPATVSWRPIVQRELDRLKG